MGDIMIIREGDGTKDPVSLHRFHQEKPGSLGSMPQKRGAEELKGTDDRQTKQRTNEMQVYESVQYRRRAFMTPAEMNAPLTHEELNSLDATGSSKPSWLRLV